MVPIVYIMFINVELLVPLEVEVWCIFNPHNAGSSTEDVNLRRFISKKN